MAPRRSVDVLSTAMRAIVAVCLMGLGTAVVGAQGLGGAGTVQGVVKDPTGGVMQAVEVKLSNPVTGLTRTSTTDAAGRYVFSNLPPNPYHITVEAQGFQTLQHDVDVRSAVPIDVDLTLALASATSTVQVVSPSSSQKVQVGQPTTNWGALNPPPAIAWAPSP